MELLKVENLTFTYPKQNPDAAEPEPTLQNVSFQVQEGAFVVVCGESGCGKTTLLKLLKRELAPAGERSGNIWFHGVEQAALTEREAACEIGFVLQNPENQTVTDKVWHELAFGLENMGVPTPVIRRRVAEMACFFGIDDWFRKKTTELSGGQKQLLNLAAVMVMQPKLLILDEPTSQLDPIAASDFINTLRKINKELGLTIIMTEHRLEDVFPVADQALIMDQGRVLLMEPPRQAGKDLKKLNSDHKMLVGMPSALRIYHGLDVEEEECPLTVRDGRMFLEKNYRNEIRHFERQNETVSEDAPFVMRMKDICFRYAKDLPDVLEGVALSVRQGEIISLLGGNGAGKTTLLKIISGTCKPYRGKIEVFGKRLQKYSGKELYVNKLAFLPQNPQTVFLKMTVREDYAEVRKTMGYSKEQMAQKTEEIAATLHIEHLLDRHLLFSSRPPPPPVTQAAKSTSDSRSNRPLPSAPLSPVVKLADELPFWGLPCPCAGADAHDDAASMSSGAKRSSSYTPDAAVTMERGTRSWRDASRFAACTAVSQGLQSAAASATQNTTAAPPQTAQAAPPAAGLVLPSPPSPISF